jgi:SAM-dependent methyltransferase
MTELIGEAEADAGLPIPDEDLRFRVTGLPQSPEEFRISGRRTLADWTRALRVVDRSLESFRRVLDFGCGPGRVTRHLAGLASLPDREVHGCDIDGDAIAWADKELPGIAFHHNGYLPPLPFEDDYFDVVLNHSVFSHLPEDYQDAWLAEISRVLEPDGYAVLSVCGQHAFDGLVESWRRWPQDPAPIEKTFYGEGFLYISDDSWQGSTFPDFYHSAFHSANYVLRHWADYLRIVAYLPRAGLDYQDIVVLQNSNAAAAFA